MKYPTPEEILLHHIYDPVSGTFRFRTGAREGRPAGAQQRNGTIRIRVGEHKYRALTLAWIVTRGEIPAPCRVRALNDLPFDARPDNLTLDRLPGHPKRKKRKGPVRTRVKLTVSLPPGMIAWLRKVPCPVSLTVEQLIQKAMVLDKAT